MLILKGDKANSEEVKLSDNAEEIYYKIEANDFSPCYGELCIEDFDNTKVNTGHNCLGCFFHNKEHNLCICKEFLKCVSEMDNDPLQKILHGKF